MRKGTDAEIEKNLRWGRMAKMTPAEVFADVSRADSSGSKVSGHGAPLRRPLTELALAARRRNARQCIGPRTEEGKRRSALNAMKWGLRSKNYQLLMAMEGRDPFAYRRLHRLLIYLFEPWNPVYERLVGELAEAWSEKLGASDTGPFDDRGRRRKRSSVEEQRAGELDELVEEQLRLLLGAMANHSRKWNYMLRKRLGLKPREYLDLSASTECLRVEIESRLAAHREQLADFHEARQDTIQEVASRLRLQRSELVE